MYLDPEYNIHPDLKQRIISTKLEKKSPDMRKLFSSCTLTTQIKSSHFLTDFDVNLIKVDLLHPVHDAYTRNDMVLDISVFTWPHPSAMFLFVLKMTELVDTLRSVTSVDINI